MFSLKWAKKYDRLKSCVWLVSSFVLKKRKRSVFVCFRVFLELLKKVEATYPVS